MENETIEALKAKVSEARSANDLDSAIAGNQDEMDILKNAGLYLLSPVPWASDRRYVSIDGNGFAVKTPLPPDAQPCQGLRPATDHQVLLVMLHEEMQELTQCIEAPMRFR